jgi:hypothetical protein
MITEILEAPVETFPFSLTEVVNALGALSPEAIRDLLLAQGVKGYHSAFHCPLANFLRARGFDSPMVGHFVVLGGGRRVPTPASVVRFIRSFDGGHLPELVGK